MKKISAFVAGSALALTAATAFAGGPVVVEEEPTPMAAPVSSAGSLGGLGGGAAAAAAAVVAIAAVAASDSGNH